MNRISIKLAINFFVAVLIMQSALMVYLHQNIIHARINEEFQRLLATGSNHRQVLVDYYSENTMKHIALMEENKEREVVIIDSDHHVLVDTFENDEWMAQYIPLLKKLDATSDEMIVTNWRESPYLISVHPYSVNEKKNGYVVLFQSTKAIEQLVKGLNRHFFFAGMASIVALVLIYAILSKFLTRPLLRMTEATEKLSKGNFQVSLPVLGSDELGDLSRSIQRLADDLERLKKERSEFLASVAHELSTPLTYLIGYSKIAKRTNISTEEQRKYLHIIEEEAEQLKELVKNLLDLAKMDENTFTVQKHTIEITPFIHHLLRLIQPSFEMKQVQLEVNLTEDFTFEADPVRLEQILLNLLDNALKYSQAYSVVTLDIRKEEEQVRMAITDMGSGIPPEDIPFIFDKLYRVEKSRSRNHGGSGIGLAVVKELVEAHGGSIEVVSHVDIGSTFIVRI